MRSLVRAIVKESLEEQGTMRFWHGGNLDVYDDMIAHKKGRNEYGPGLYLITHYGTAREYAKGSRKFYMVTVQKGKDMNDSVIPMDKAKEFVHTHVIGTKRKAVLTRISEWDKNGTMDAGIFNNIMINEEALRASGMGHLRGFYVEHGIIPSMKPVRATSLTSTANSVRFWRTRTSTDTTCKCGARTPRQSS